MTGVSGERCDRSDLLVGQCACPAHRGGGDLAEVETVGQPFDAMYGGRCERFEREIHVGQSIARTADAGGYVHTRCPR